MKQNTPKHRPEMKCEQNVGGIYLIGKFLRANQCLLKVEQTISLIDGALYTPFAPNNSPHQQGCVS